MVSVMLNLCVCVCVFGGVGCFLWGFINCLQMALIRQAFTSNAPREERKRGSMMVLQRCLFEVKQRTRTSGCGIPSWRARGHRAVMATEIICWWKLLLARILSATHASSTVPCLHQPAHTHGLRQHGRQGPSRKGAGEGEGLWPPVPKRPWCFQPENCVSFAHHTSYHSVIAAWIA